MKALAITLVSLFAPAATLAACAVVPSAPAATIAWPAEAPVPIGQPVRVGDIIVTPLKIVEDSRCPMNARCVWAGRLIVQTRIEGTSWRETANLSVGEVYRTHDRMLSLASVAPDKTTAGNPKIRDYRFVFERRDDRMGGPPPVPKR